jgi:serine phosphatase RsbU (regulator of sigma subunit)
MARLGVETLPERLAGTRLTRAVPIVFPSLARPLPQVSYGAVLRGERAALSPVAGRIALLGQVDDPLSDFIPVPTLQLLGDGRLVSGLPGVSVLAAITETLLQDMPLRDVSWPGVLACNTVWCALLVSLLPRHRPWLGLLGLIVVIAAALSAVGGLQVRLGLVLPAGLLFGCLFVTGGYTVITSHVETAKRFHVEKAEKERLRHEMGMARRTQERLLPRSLPRIPGWDIWGINICSLEVSGDYYDVLAPEQQDLVWVVIADVSGKGLPASLIMSNVHAALHSRIHGGVTDPGLITTDLSQFLFEHTPVESFVTFFLGVLRPETGHFRYVSAGHEEPLFLTACGEWRRSETAGPPLGAFPDLRYESVETRLSAGDVVCLYTDGVSEAIDSSERMYGLERLRQVVVTKRDSTAQGLGEAILASVYAFTGKRQQDDDITLVTMKALGCF